MHNVSITVDKYSNIVQYLHMFFDKLLKLLIP